MPRSSRSWALPEGVVHADVSNRRMYSVAQIETDHIQLALLAYELVDIYNVILPTVSMPF